VLNETSLTKLDAVLTQLQVQGRFCSAPVRLHILRIQLDGLPAVVHSLHKQPQQNLGVRAVAEEPGVQNIVFTSRLQASGVALDSLLHSRLRVGFQAIIAFLF